MRILFLIPFLAMPVCSFAQHHEHGELNVDTLTTGKLLGEMVVRELFSGDLIEHVATGNSAGMEYELLNIAQQALYLVVADAGSKDKRRKLDEHGKQPPTNPDHASPAIMTTSEEWQAFDVVRSILEPTGYGDRISTDDNLSYCAILLDYSYRRTICRLYFNDPMAPYAIIHDRKGGTRVELSDPGSLYLHSDRLVAAARAMDKGNGRKLK